MSGWRSSSSYSHVVPDRGAPAMMNVGPSLVIGGPAVAYSGGNSLSKECYVIQYVRFVPHPSRSSPPPVMNSLTVEDLGKRYYLGRRARSQKARATLDLGPVSIPLPWGKKPELRELWALRHVSFTVRPGTILGV